MFLENVILFFIDFCFVCWGNFNLVKLIVWINYSLSYCYLFEINEILCYLSDDFNNECK